MRLWLVAVTVTGLAATGMRAQGVPQKGVRLETHTWVEAQALLTPAAVVVIPLGAALKEHGPHLQLRNDLLLADGFTRRILDASNVVMTPPLTYHFYPAFIEYPGSTTLTFETARDFTTQIIRSLARFGPRRFYVLNTGVSTLRPLQAAAEALAAEGILMRFTQFGPYVEEAAARIRQQEGGSHADELETSMMLHLEPSTVIMKNAVRDFSPASSSSTRLTRQQGAPGTYSPTGTWGDPTLATAAKGQIIVDGVVTRILQDIETLRAAEPPTAVATSPVPPPRPAPAPAPVPPRATTPRSPECLAGDERAIRSLADGYNFNWSVKDAVSLAALWADTGDIVHPDGATERGRFTIQRNRAEQFMRKEYSASKHTLAFGNVRCLSTDAAVVDGKWELRGVTDGAGTPRPKGEGLISLVVQRSEGSWRIEAYRYTVTQQAPVAPTLLKKPGYPEIIK